MDRIIQVGGPVISIWTLRKSSSCFSTDVRCGFQGVELIVISKALVRSVAARLKSRERDTELHRSQMP
jgi:hypothetical protein